MKAEVVGRLERDGIGSNVLGDPRVAFAWLVNEVTGLGLQIGRRRSDHDGHVRHSPADPGRRPLAHGFRRIGPGRNAISICIAPLYFRLITLRIFHVVLVATVPSNQ